MELAVAGQAKMLFSGDRDLLVLSAEFERMAACTIVPLDGLIELLA
jgi:predicted nucleic acid-binding protein